MASSSSLTVMVNRVVLLTEKDREGSGREAGTAMGQEQDSNRLACAQGTSRDSGIQLKLG